MTATDAAAKFLNETGSTLICVGTDYMYLDAIEYSMELRRNNHTFRFKYMMFSQRYYNPLPTPEILFRSLHKWNPGNFTDWCQDNDKNSDSISDKKQWKEQLRQYKNLTVMYTWEEINYLRTHF